MKHQISIVKKGEKKEKLNQPPKNLIKDQSKKQNMIYEVKMQK